MNVRIHIDGGARGNPGLGGAGVLIESADDGKTLYEAGVFLGKVTNNVAEYRGLLTGLAAAAELKAVEVDVYSDSELLVRQMTGQYRVKNAGLQELYQEARQLVRGLARCDFHHVRREENTRADSLVNLAIDCADDVGGFVE